jgi:hypothetical protein
VETAEARIVVLPDLGARVVSMLDRRRGREWLAQGRPPDALSAWASGEAVFAGAQAFGWDECLPTVVSSVDLTSQDRSIRLRDHGALWGRPAQVQVEQGHLVSTWRPDDWPGAIERVITLEGAEVSIRYRVTSHAARPLPFLWSMHPLLTLEPGTRLELPGVGHASVGGVIGMPVEASGTVAWPVSVLPSGPIDWSLVVDGDAGTAAKLYVPAPPHARVVTPDGAALELTWDRGFAPTLGLWLTYGGWHPDGPRLHQVALEPATSGDDALATAAEAGRAVTVGPGATVEWWVRIRMRPPPGDIEGGSGTS